jgi:ubiquinone biosynthesis protein
MITHAPDMPRLLHAWLQQQVEGRHQLSMRSDDIGELVQVLTAMQRRTVSAIVGVGLLLVASVLYALGSGGPALWSVPVASWVSGAVGVWVLLAAWLRR